jgi:hypothetical protein
MCNICTSVTDGEHMDFPTVTNNICSSTIRYQEIYSLSTPKTIINRNQLL